MDTQSSSQTRPSNTPHSNTARSPFQAVNSPCQRPESRQTSSKTPSKTPGLPNHRFHLCRSRPGIVRRHQGSSSNPFQYVPKTTRPFCYTPTPPDMSSRPSQPRLRHKASSIAVDVLDNRRRRPIHHRRGRDHRCRDPGASPHPRKTNQPTATRTQVLHRRDDPSSREDGHRRQARHPSRLQAEAGLPRPAVDPAARPLLRVSVVLLRRGGPVPRRLVYDVFRALVLSWMNTTVRRTGFDVEARRTPA